MRDFTSELFRREIPCLLHLGDTGGPRLSRPGPAPGLLGRPAPTRRVSPRRNCSEVKSHVPYTLDHTGGPCLSRPGPAPGPLGRPVPRAARVLRAPTRRVSPRRNCSDVKSRVSCTSATRDGRACRGRVLHGPISSLPRPGPHPPCHGLAREVPVPPSARGVRTPPPCPALAQTHNGPGVAHNGPHHSPPSTRPVVTAGHINPRLTREISSIVGVLAQEKRIGIHLADAPYVQRRVFVQRDKRLRIIVVDG